VLNPTRVREYLGKFLLGYCERCAVGLKQHGARAGGSLIDAENKWLAHS